MPDDDEEDWLIKLSWIIEEINNKKLTIIRLIFGVSLFTLLQKEVLQEMMKFLQNYYPHLNVHLFFTPTRELTKKEKQAIIKEAHSTHLGEENTLEKAKTIGLWLGMDNEIKKYVQCCPICQLQKTTRIKNQAKSILPDIPLAPNEKLALDIFGPLPETQKGNRYILSM